MVHTNPFPTSAHRRALLGELQSTLVVAWSGVHGITHWARVRANAMRIARGEGDAEIDLGVAELFALLHDSCRWSDGEDPEHGQRAARRARELRGSFFELSDARLATLCEACEGHSHDQRSDCPTVHACWDADRLDLGRVGIRPDPARLATDTARRAETIDWAHARSLRWVRWRRGAAPARPARPLSFAEEGAYQCDSCGEEIVIPVDGSAGERQEYVEDCPVCCCPNVIRVELGEDGEAHAQARTE